MSAPSESTVTAAGSGRPCGLTSLMSCRGKAEAFARRLQSRLRTLGTHGGSVDGTNGDGGGAIENSESTWLSPTEGLVTSLQPLRNNVSQHEADSFFDFDLEHDDSPGSPIDECEYSRLIETATTTPQASDIAPESGYVCASPISAEEASLASQSSSSDGPYYDPESSDVDQRSLATDYYDCIGVVKKEASRMTNYSGGNGHGRKARRMRMPNEMALSNGPKVMANGHLHSINDSDADSCSDSLPPSQTTTASGSTATKSESNSTITGLSSNSNNTLHDETETEDGECCQSTTISQRMCKEASAAVTNEVDEDATEAASNENITNGKVEEEGVEEGGRAEEEEEARGEESMEVCSPEAEVTKHQLNGYAKQNGTIANNNTDHDEVDHVSLEEAIGDDGGRLDGSSSSEERIILECLNIIEATPDASPEPEVRPSAEGDAEPDENGNQLKVDEDVESGDRPQRVRRCSSLKSGKTPPGTPGRKKAVRFADVLGLDLAAVRTFMDEMPKIPKSAFEDLDLPSVDEPVSLGPRVDKVLMPLFQQPGALSSFLDTVRDRQVCLENAAVTDAIMMTITGSVRVRNLDFHKSVYVRYSTDSWRSFSDLQATYVDNSCDGFSDKFTFVLYGNALHVGERIEMAVRFHCKGQIYWDNNFGTNYCFQCLPMSAPIRSVPIAPVPIDDFLSGASFY